MSNIRHFVLYSGFILSMFALAFATSCEGGIFMEEPKSDYSLEQDEYESDNGFLTTANTIKFGAANRQTHSIFSSDKTADDLDFIKMNGTVGKYYQIQTRMAKNDTVDTVLSLKNDAGTELASDDNGGEGGKLSLINWWLCPASATYMIVVSGKNMGYYGIDVEEFNGAIINSLPYSENFEGTRSSPWTAWRSDNVVTYGGSLYSAKTAGIANDEATSIQLMIDIPAPGKTLAFYWRVNSEENKDWFTCYLDGVELDRISGNVTWEAVTASLSAGKHLIKWEYKKNGSKATDYDCGWLDSITIE